MTDQVQKRKSSQSVYDAVKVFTGVIVLWFALAGSMLVIRLIGEQRLRRFLHALPRWKRAADKS